MGEQKHTAKCSISVVTELPAPIRQNLVKGPSFGKLVQVPHFARSAAENIGNRPWQPV
jgi:hypothetical protein